MEDLVKSMNRMVKSRLASYTDNDKCGGWNCNLLADFQNDLNFVRTSQSLCEAALLTVLRESPVSDGFSISGVDIEIGKTLSIRFELCFLSPSYFYTPAEFTLELLPDNPDRGIGSYRCGTTDAHGEFRFNSKHCVFPFHSSEWASCFSLELSTGH